MGNRTKEKVEEYVNEWESRCYTRGIPDEAPIELNKVVPCYKKIALAILNNDLNLYSLGFPVKHSKYYSAYKRIEIAQRIYEGKQLKLF